MCCHSLLQGIFPTQGSNPGLLHQSQMGHKAEGLKAMGILPPSARTWKRGERERIRGNGLKGETVPDSLPASPKSPPTRRGPPRGTPRVPAPLPLSPFSPPDHDRRGDSPAWSGRSAFPLGWPWEAQSSPRVARESWGLRSSHCRAEETSPRRVSGT